MALHAAVAEMAASLGETERGWFHLTHAWVFALEAGDPRASDLQARLAAAGRV